MANDEQFELVLSGFPVRKEDQIRAHISEYVPRDGYVQVKCEKCGIPVWIGPRQNMTRIVTNSPVWCVMCVLAHQKKFKPGEDFSVHSLGGESAKIVLDDGREIKASFEI